MEFLMEKYFCKILRRDCVIVLVSSTNLLVMIRTFRKNRYTENRKSNFCLKFKFLKFIFYIDMYV